MSKNWLFGICALFVSFVWTTALSAEAIRYELVPTSDSQSELAPAEFAVLNQPEAPVDPRDGTPTVRRRSSVNPLLGTRRPARMQRVPAMFGDFQFSSVQAIIDAGDDGVNVAVVDLPLAAGARASKVAENNKALTGDRCYFLYNHFHNALSSQVLDAPVRRELPVDRYTIGFERSFHDGLCSAELRMPFAGTFSFAFAAAGESTRVDGGNIGNLAVILKRMLWETDELGIAAGCGFELPTGSDATAIATDLTVTLKNDAFHLLPFVGATWVPNELVFIHTFLQLDVNTNGNAVEFNGTVNRLPSGFELGKFNEQNLLLLDVSSGVWLLRNPAARHLTGLAALLELHYATTLQDTDVFTLVAADNFAFANLGRHTDILNTTVALHAELAGDWSLRVAGVWPLKLDEDQRSFDAEVFVSLIKQH